ncbi:ankyrin repeat domain-containing protein 13D isoform X2 [Anopheles cruzii]|uniref:ankyrin repeat domain-containing protein 13D isoform X2 n=1 Tax=Anopheles cruzii TaxID=68878 RepID=UPI0022EC8545|nr:ankyrin repeat domain-containing protein 13D isoform X2 [Anopheles cruzii]XP_052862150.1 ankyrin repeat domain-containing protein 13D isoform X2 [Anopheles cruzii]
MSTIDRIKEAFPIHWHVWNNDFQELQQAINEKSHDLEKLDPRGRTPLMLAVKLCHLECVKALLGAKCNANVECDGWSVVQEAVCSGDANILTAILEVRDLQRHIKRVSHVPQLLQHLQDTPDFYVEMKWEFTSWVPLMSRVCPSDTYKVFKRGANVRIDTTLLGFDNNTWQRGNRSYIYKGHSNTASMIEIDHDTGEVSIEHMRNIESENIDGIRPSREAVQLRLQAPVICNHIDMDKISFERNKSGFWGWRSEKVESINGYECKVYGASNVKFITRTRNEHLGDDQGRTKNSRTPLQHFLGMTDEDYDHTASGSISALRETSSPVGEDRSPDGSEAGAAAIGGQGATNSSLAESQQQQQQAPTAEEYFSDIDLGGRDIGKAKRVSAKEQHFKANMWLSEEFPIKLQEQVLPILDLMSTMASPHVSKLRDFITMQLPSGFPVKIEIPLFHVLNAVVTFGNVFATEHPVPHVSNIQESDDRVSCIIDDACFEVPSEYGVRRSGTDFRQQLTFEDEDELMQFAIQQSLVESGSENDKVDIWEALKAPRPLTPQYYEDEQLQSPSRSVSGDGKKSNTATSLIGGMLPASIARSPLKKLFSKS